MGIRPFISGEQGIKSLKLEGTRELRQFWGTGNIENSDFGEQGIAQSVARFASRLATHLCRVGSSPAGDTMTRYV